MQKPIKPTISQEKPKETLYKDFVLCKNLQGLFLKDISESYALGVSISGSLEKHEEILDEDDFNQNVIKFLNDIPFEHFTLECIRDQDSYFEYWGISVREPNIKYDQELEEFNNRKSIYDEQLKKYYSDLKIYETFVLEKSIKDLQDRLSLIKKDVN